MVLMAVLGAVLVAGLVLTIRWARSPYVAWPADPEGDTPRTVARYARGVAVALVGGFWAGALVTGPAIRLIMRLLAVTAGDRAQGRLTEAQEVVGEISIGGTIGLYVFSGLFVGLASGFLYAVLRRLLPPAWVGGLAFGALHLVVGATRVEPLRPDNPDFVIVGPAWLAVVAFGATAILHGVAVVAFANRYSRVLAPGTRLADVRVAAPLLPAALLLVLGSAVVLVLVMGLLAAVVLARFEALSRFSRDRRLVLAGRVVLVGIAVAFLPGAVTDLVDIAG